MLFEERKTALTQFLVGMKLNKVDKELAKCQSHVVRRTKNCFDSILSGYEIKQVNQATRSFQQFICILKLKIVHALLTVSQQTLTSST